MVVALFVAAGLGHSETLRRWANCLTASALTLVVIVALCAGKWSTLTNQQFLFQGSDGVSSNQFPTRVTCPPNFAHFSCNLC